RHVAATANHPTFGESNYAPCGADLSRHTKLREINALAAARALARNLYSPLVRNLCALREYSCDEHDHRDSDPQHHPAVHGAPGGRQPDDDPDDPRRVVGDEADP